MCANAAQRRPRRWDDEADLRRLPPDDEQFCAESCADFHVCGLPMRGRAEDLVGAHASSRGHSATKSGPAQSMRLTLLHVHVALRHVAIPHVNIPRPCCAPFLWLLCFFTSSCAVDAFPLPAVRAPSLGPVHQVEQFDPVHRAGTSARISSCVMCSTANVQDWAYWEDELALWSTKDLLQSEHADEYVAIMWPCFRRAPGGSASQRRPSGAISSALRR